jgi:hypothetical protein
VLFALSASPPAVRLSLGDGEEKVDFMNRPSRLESEGLACEFELSWLERRRPRLLRPPMKRRGGPAGDLAKLCVFFSGSVRVPAAACRNAGEESEEVRTSLLLLLLLLLFLLLLLLSFISLPSECVSDQCMSGRGVYFLGTILCYCAHLAAKLIRRGWEGGRGGGEQRRRREDVDSSSDAWIEWLASLFPKGSHHNPTLSILKR